MLIQDTTAYTLHAPGTALIYHISSKHKKGCKDAHEFIKNCHIQAALVVSGAFLKDLSLKR